MKLYEIYSTVVCTHEDASARVGFVAGPDLWTWGACIVLFSISKRKAVDTARYLFCSGMQKVYFGSSFAPIDFKQWVSSYRFIEECM